MGINGLLSFLRERCPEAFQDIPYSRFRGKRVAVDSDNVLRKLMSRAHKEVVNETDVCVAEPDRKIIRERWLFHLKEELVKYVNHGIHLVFVFDGAYIDEKSETQLKRRTEKQKRVNEAETLKAKIMELDPLERTPQMVTDLRKKMHHLSTITQEEKAEVQEILKALGFPVLTSTGEGEKLCAMLCIEGLVSAVYSRDSDLVAMGCPIFFSEEAGWVYNPQSGRTEQSLKSVCFRPILAKLGMEYKTFLDLCIMSGCDFNSNIYRVGIVTSYKLLSKCGQIENLPEKYSEKVDILNYQRCREILSSQHPCDICCDELSLNNTGITNQEFLEKAGLSDWISEFNSLYSDFPEVNCRRIYSPPSLASSKLALSVSKKIPIPVQKASPKKQPKGLAQNLANQQLVKLRAKLVSEK
jgi:5'-3' exonuclease